MIAASFTPSDASGVQSSHPSDGRLRRLLDRLAQSALVYREFALKFSCQEKIIWTTQHKHDSAAFNYVFVFEEGFGFHDYRTPLRKPPRGKPQQEVSPERYDVPAYLASPYLWIFSFRTERQARHEYQLVGEETLDSQATVVIRFEPIQPVLAGVNDWYGTAWVDEQAAQLLKVEAYTPVDWTVLERMRRHLALEEGGGHFDVQRITTIFSLVRNGMRFPSKVELRMERLYLVLGKEQPGTRASTIWKVDQEYTNYEFFGVEALVTPK